MNRIVYPLVIAIVAAFTFTTLSYGADYVIDPDHSNVGFKVRHIVSKVPGRFTKFSGTFSFEKDKPESWKIDATINAASIDTDNKKRDAHLRSADFFDTKKYPKITFKSTEVVDDDDEEPKIKGLLTMRGVTKPVVLDVELGGTGTDPWGNNRIGMTAKTKINRKDFGVNWNKALDKGGYILGDEVEIMLEISASEQKVEAKKAKKK